jgi:hypothetical protein
MTDTQTEAATGAAILKEMVDGLEGVSPGGWECDWTDSENDEGTFNSQLLWDKDGGVIADAINSNATRIITEYSGDGDEYVDVIDVQAMNNFRHIARCSPDNIRAIASYVEALEAENKAMREVLETQCAQIRAETLEEAAWKATSFLVGDPLKGIPLSSPSPHEIAAAIRNLIVKGSPS